MNFENDSAFVYVIYDKDTYEIFDMFITEKICVSVYKELYEGFVNVDWKAVNIIDALRRT